MKRPTKKELLDHYARRAPQTFYQYDCFVNIGEGDCVMQPDEDGDTTFTSVTYELMSGVPVRVLINPEGATKGDVLRALCKIMEFIDKDGFKFHEEKLAEAEAVQVETELAQEAWAQEALASFRQLEENIRFDDEAWS